MNAEPLTETLPCLTCGGMAVGRPDDDLRGECARFGTVDLSFWEFGGAFTASGLDGYVEIRDDTRTKDTAH